MTIQSIDLKLGDSANFIQMSQVIGASKTSLKRKKKVRRINSYVPSLGSSLKHCRSAFYSNCSTFAFCQKWKVYKAWREKICILGILSKFPETSVASHSSESYFIIIWPPRYHLLWNISAVVSTFYFFNSFCFVSICFCECRIPSVYICI